MIIHPRTRLQGTIQVPGDKSISHRSIMLGALAKGTTRIKGFLMGDDCLSTIRCFRDMGIQIDIQEDQVIVEGKGLHGLEAPKDTLDVGNSGTTFRLLSGILAAQDFDCMITGDASIRKRPMKRIMTPLQEMGADITSLSGNGLAPLRIHGKKLRPISYQSPVASAQVKSCILLASLYVDEPTEVTEPVLSRNHSELMLNAFGAAIQTEGSRITSSPVEELIATDILVPGDISSAAYFLVAGLIMKDSDITIKQVGINPTRDGIIRVLKAMKGDITIQNERTINGERVADLRVKSSSLQGTVVDRELIPTLIDEIPAIAVAACFAEGTTVIKDAAELRVKESDRIETMVTELRKMGADIKGTDDGMIINPSPTLQGATIETYHDHRVAMSMTIAALMAESPSTITGSECVDISFPDFFALIDTIS